MASTASSWRPAAWRAAVGALTWRDRWLLLETFVWLPVFWIFLRFVTFRRLYRWCLGWTGGERPAGRLSSADELEDVRHIGRVVAMASRHAPVPGTCLHRSLALWWVLRLRGFASDLRFGVRKVDGSLTAHAWVEHDGVVINDDPAVAGDYVNLPWIDARTRP